MATNTSRLASLLALFLTAAPSEAQQAVRVNLDSSGNEVTVDDQRVLDVSASGRRILFYNHWPDYESGRGVYVRDTATGSVVLVSVDGTGTPIPSTETIRGATMSADARFVVYATTHPVDGKSGTFWLDRDADEDGIYDEPGATAFERVSYYPSGNTAREGPIGRRCVSDDGRYVAWTVEDPNTNLHTLYRRDTLLDVSELVIQHGVDPGTRFPDIEIGQMTADGESISFVTGRDGLVDAPTSVTDTNNRIDGYVWDASTGTFECMTKNVFGQMRSGPGTLSDIQSMAMSSNGQYFAFTSSSYAGDLFFTTPMTIQADQAFRRRRGLNAITWASPISGTPQLTIYPEVGPTGVTYFTSYSPLDLNDPLNTADVFRFKGGSVTQLSVYLLNQVRTQPAAHSGLEPSVASRDGAALVFPSRSADLVAGDQNYVSDLFGAYHASRGKTIVFGQSGNIPSLDLAADPILGSTVSLTLNGTPGPVAIRYGIVPAEQNIADVLVPLGSSGAKIHPGASSVNLTMPASGTMTLPATFPDDTSLVGMKVHIQLIQIDNGVFVSSDVLEAFLGYY